MSVPPCGCDNKKIHNMLALMLDPRFKSLRLIFCFIGHEDGVP
jgi:hypothetical protein